MSFVDFQQTLKHIFSTYFSEQLSINCRFRTELLFCLKEIAIATFDSPSDEEEPVFVVLAQVARVQPALSIQGLLRLIGHVEIAHKDVAAPEADLAVALCIRIVQLRFAPGNLFAAAVTQKRHGSNLTCLCAR